MTTPNQAMNSCEGSEALLISEVGAPGIDLPLLTFALFAYNQEKYIREAVEGALAQTYRPLQIILSDDCSTDSTFAIMQKMIAEYIGPHEILLNQNTENMGIGEHVNHVINLCKGVLIVTAAGDDISNKKRTETIYQAWVAEGRPICSIYSKALEIDQFGKIQGSIGRTWNNELPLSTMIAKMMPGVMGSTHAFHRSIFEVFGPMLPGSVYEDRILPFRSHLLGRVIYIDSQLVKYRIHSSGVSGQGTLLIRANPTVENLLKHFKQLFSLNLNVYSNYKKDIGILCGKSITTPHKMRLDCITSMVDRLCFDACARNLLLNTSTLISRLQHLGRLRPRQVRLESIWILITLTISPKLFVVLWRFIHAGPYRKLKQFARTAYVNARGHLCNRTN